MSNAVRAESVHFSMRLNDANALTFERVLQSRWQAFCSIWWDIGLVATPARAILAAASVAHDAVDEWRDEFPYLLHDVPCCFRITRHTWTRSLWRGVGRSYRHRDDKRDLRAHIRAWERAEWPPLPGRNDYRGNVRDTAWADEWCDTAIAEPPAWDIASIAGQSNAIGALTSWSTAPQASIATLLAMRDAMLAAPVPQAMLIPPDLYERLRVHYAIDSEPAHHDIDSYASFGAALARVAPVSKTNRQHIDRAARRKRKRGRR